MEPQGQLNSFHLQKMAALYVFLISFWFVSLLFATPISGKTEREELYDLVLTDVLEKTKDRTDLDDLRNSIKEEQAKRSATIGRGFANPDESDAPTYSAASDTENVYYTITAPKDPSKLGVNSNCFVRPIPKDPKDPDAAEHVILILPKIPTTPLDSEHFATFYMPKIPVPVDLPKDDHQFLQHIFDEGCKKVLSEESISICSAQVREYIEKISSNLLNLNFSFVPRPNCDNFQTSDSFRIDETLTSKCTKHCDDIPPKIKERRDQTTHYYPYFCMYECLGYALEHHILEKAKSVRL